MSKTGLNGEIQGSLGRSMSLDHTSSKELKRSSQDNLVQKKARVDPPNSSRFCGTGSAVSSSKADRKNLHMSSSVSSGVLAAKSNAQNSSMSSPKICPGALTLRTDQEHVETASSSVPASRTDKGKPLVHIPMISSGVSPSKSNGEHGPIRNMVPGSDVPAPLSEKGAASQSKIVAQLSPGSKFHGMKSVAHDRRLTSSFQIDRHIRADKGKHQNGERSEASSDVRQPENPIDLTTQAKENNPSASCISVERSCSGDMPSSMSSVAIALKNPIIPDIDSTWRYVLSLFDKLASNLCFPITSYIVLLNMTSICNTTCRGEFQIYSSGKAPGSFKGIQAHLSTGAATKVGEAMKEFPSIMLLQELPRPSRWPRQFFSEGPKEDDIALYFFAEDYKRFLGEFSS